MKTSKNLLIRLVTFLLIPQLISIPGAFANTTPIAPDETGQYVPTRTPDGFSTSQDTGVTPPIGDDTAKFLNNSPLSTPDEPSKQGTTQTGYNFVITKETRDAKGRQYYFVEEVRDNNGNLIETRTRKSTTYDKNGNIISFSEVVRLPDGSAIVLNYGNNELVITGNVYNRTKNIDRTMTAYDLAKRVVFVDAANISEGADYYEVGFYDEQTWNTGDGDFAKRTYRSKYDKTGLLIYEAGEVYNGLGTKLYDFTKSSFSYDGSSLNMYSQRIILAGDRSVLNFVFKNGTVTLKGDLKTEGINLRREFGNVGSETEILFAREGKDESLQPDYKVVSPYERAAYAFNYEIWSYKQLHDARGRLYYEEAFVKNPNGNTIYKLIRNINYNKPAIYYTEKLIFPDGRATTMIVSNSHIDIRGYYGGTSDYIKSAFYGIGKNERIFFISEEYLMLCNTVTGGCRFVTIYGKKVGNADGDLLPDPLDPDDDNDGILDADDQYPYDPLNNTFPLFDASGNEISLPSLTNNPALSFYNEEYPGQRVLYET
ncbi:MAG: hypothetical protein PHW54_06460, partial [Candidatus Omnitrophica bacterium]|nr:hypothetical protein [Candidatus Omnitrophota bacterium]